MTLGLLVDRFKNLYFIKKVIDAFVDIVANHLGFLSFALCENNDPSQDKTQECFDKNRLKTEDGRDFVLVPNVIGEDLYISISSNLVIIFLIILLGRVVVRLQLPANLTCWQCILQFNYITGNSWGIGPQNPDFSTPGKFTQNFMILIGCKA